MSGYTGEQAHLRSTYLFRKHALFIPSYCLLKVSELVNLHVACILLPGTDVSYFCPVKNIASKLMVYYLIGY